MSYTVKRFVTSENYTASATRETHDVTKSVQYTVKSCGAQGIEEGVFLALLH